MSHQNFFSNPEPASRQQDFAEAANIQNCLMGAEILVKSILDNAASEAFQRSPIPTRALLHAIRKALEVCEKKFTELPSPKSTLSR